MKRRVAKPAAKMKYSVIPSHRWTHTGQEVLIVKCTDAHGVAYNGFKYPDIVGSEVTAPDWQPDNKCGSGLHGWPWGLGIGDGNDPNYQGRWYVVGAKPEEVIGNIEYGTKCKFRSGVVRYVGPWAGALSFILEGRIAYDFQASRGSASNSGDRGSAETTHAGTAAIVTGLYGKARAAEFGCVALAWHNKDTNRIEMRCALTGYRAGELKPDVWYQLDEDSGNFKEAI